MDIRELSLALHRVDLDLESYITHTPNVLNCEWRTPSPRLDLPVVPISLVFVLLRSRDITCINTWGYLDLMRVSATVFEFGFMLPVFMLFIFLFII